MSKKKKDDKIDLGVSIKRLRAARKKLQDIDDDELENLPPEQRREWARSLQGLSVAIMKLETADLQNLSAQFIKREPELRAVALKLDNDLTQLTDAVEMINVASAAVETVTGIISLLA